MMKKIDEKMFQKNPIIEDQLCEKLKLPKKRLVKCRQDGLKSKGNPNECHCNVAKMVYRYGGHHLMGYEVRWIGPAGKEVLLFNPHSIWLNPEGEMVCLTMGHKYEEIHFIAIGILDQNEIKDFWATDKKINIVPDFFANDAGDWIIFDDKYDAPYFGSVLTAPKAIRRRELKKLRRANPTLVGDIKIRNVNKTIHYLRDKGDSGCITREWVMNRPKFHQFLPDVEIPRPKYFKRAA